MHRTKPSAAEPTAQPATITSIRRDPLISRVARNLAERCGVGSGSRVVVGASGGADSTALMLACAALRDRTRGPATRLDPMVVHVHHHLRPDADDDADAVQRLCEELGLPARVEHVHPRDRPGNLAANAREDRYAALARAARRGGAPLVAVAHTADDQLETMLMAWGRGTGVDGLAAMRWRRPLDEGVDLVRPTLDVERLELEALCARAGVSWCNDPSNASTESARTRLRHSVVPILESLWPGVAARSVGLSDELEAAAATLEDAVDVALGPAGRRSWSRDELRTPPSIIVASGLRRAALDERPEVADEITRKQLMSVAAAIRDDACQPRDFDLAHGLRVVVRAHEVTLIRAGGPDV